VLWLRALRELICYSFAQVGKAHNKCPASSALLTDSAILMAAGFDRGVDKNKVPSWRDGDAGRALQIRMAVLLGERYFDYGSCNADASGKGFLNGCVWSAFARLHPFILACFKDMFGLNQAEWRPEPVARWSEIMRGVWDLDIETLSDSIPDKCDKEPTKLMAIA